MTEVKSILFENAKESTAVIVFSDKIEQNHMLKFLTPKLTNFSKLFKIVLLRDNDLVEINQSDLINQIVFLKNFFVGDEQDIKLTEKIYSQCDPLSEFLIEDPDSRTGFAINNGIQIIGSENQPTGWKSYTKAEKKRYKENFIGQYAKETKNREYCIPFLECSNIEPFQVVGKYQYYKSDIEKQKNVFERVRTNDDYIGERILFPRTGTRLRAIYASTSIYYCFDIYSIQLKEPGLYPLFTAILNSDLIDYYLMIKHRKRVSDSFPKTTMNDIIKLPIPILYDEELQSKISKISIKLSKGEMSFSSCKDVLNQLIFDLYGLSKFERRKILDFFLKSRKLTTNEIDGYISTLIETIKPYISEDIKIKGTKYIDQKLASSFIGVKIEFESKIEKQTIAINQVVNYSLVQLVKEIGNANIYTTKDRIYAKNNLFFVRENNIKNWSQSRAFEDAKVFLTDLLK